MNTSNMSKLVAFTKRFVPFVTAPRYHVGPPFLNKLGLQMVRIFLNRASWHMRPRRAKDIPKEYSQSLDEEGILILPNFFHEDEFQNIEKGFQRYAHSGKPTVKKNLNNTNVDWAYGRIPVEQQNTTTYKVYSKETL